jgi:hypothetical protein
MDGEVEIEETAMMSQKIDSLNVSIQPEAEAAELRAPDGQTWGGPLDKRAEVFLRVVPVALAGGGSVTQSIQIDEWLGILSEEYAVPVRRIGVAGLDASFVAEHITGAIHPLDRPIQPATTIGNIYHNASIAITEEMRYLYASGIRHFAGVCCGYTSYGLFALQQAMAALNTAHPDDPITANVIIQDSSFPDTDALSTEVDARGYPITRFYGPAYQSTPYLRVIFTLNGAVPFDIALSERVPPGCTPIMATYPFTPRYLAYWQEAGKMPKAQAREPLAGVLPGWAKIKPTDWVIPLVASGGCWDSSSVGKWMTAEQFTTVVEGTLTIVNALRAVAQQTDRPIFMPLIRKGAELVLAQNLADVSAITQWNADGPAGVVMLLYDTLPQSWFVNFVVGADLIINRAVQANSFVETILAQTPQLVMTIPAAGYMEAELMAEGMPHSLIRYNQDPRAISAEIYQLLTDPKYRDRQSSDLQAMFASMYANPAVNFGNVLARVACLSVR